MRLRLFLIAAALSACSDGTAPLAPDASTPPSGADGAVLTSIPGPHASDPRHEAGIGVDIADQREELLRRVRQDPRDDVAMQA